MIFHPFQMISEYVSSFKYELNLPNAALQIQTAWKARGPRVFFGRYGILPRRWAP